MKLTCDDITHVKTIKIGYLLTTKSYIGKTI